MSDTSPSIAGLIPDSTVDAKDLHSPLPLLRLKKEIARLKTDAILQIDCTDPGIHDDIENWCSRMKHTFLGEKKEELYTSYLVKK